ncbi:MAG: hypothetical protein GY796_07995 [Chloroflexi bacterium]|nr:hypothetical protein [Chloroflexota bacterium]
MRWVAAHLDLVGTSVVSGMIGVKELLITGKNRSLVAWFLAEAGEVKRPDEVILSTAASKTTIPMNKFANLGIFI